MELKKEISMMLRAIRVIKEMMPRYLVYMVSRAVICGISPYINLYFSGKIVDEIIIGAPIQKLVIYVVVLVLSSFFCEMINQFLWGRIRVNQLMFDSWEEFYLNKKGLNLDYQQIENPQIRALRQKIIDNRELGGLKQLIMQLMFALNSFSHLIMSILVLPRLFLAKAETNMVLSDFINSNTSTFLMIIILFVFALVTIKITKTGAINVRKNSSEISSIQKYSHFYIDEYLDDLKVGKDIRIYAQHNLIMSTLLNMVENYVIVVKKFRKNQSIQIERKEILTYILKGILYIYIGIKAITGAIGAGSIVEFSGVVSLFLNSISGITSRFTEMKFNNKYLQVFFEYIDLCSDMYYGKEEIKETSLTDICMKNVSFKYSDSTDFSLKQINLDFHAGEKIAIVGINGSGKTTLIKLMCRLYDPYSGEITFNGKDIKEFDYKEYLSLFSIVFQDFNLFSFSIANNVSAAENYDISKVKATLEKTCILDRIENMDNGIETYIHKHLDNNGIEFSGGESQKIAIARALYKESRVMIFDEPTAALDPVAEAEIYELINSLVEDKLTIFISHRLSSCKFCSRIIVFDDGMVVQQGSHDDLIKDVNGKYHQLWKAQAQHYI